MRSQHDTLDIDVPDDAELMSRFGDAPVPPEAQQGIIRATPFEWRDPSTIPPRRWLYGRHYIRQFISTTLAPGGVGKTSLSIVEALAMVTGRDLLGERPGPPVRAWLWNGEDPRDELDRRIAAACIRYRIAPHEIAGRLFVDSGRDTEIVIAVQQPKTGTTVAEPVVADLLTTIRANKLDAIIIDPFVSSHGVSENDNNAIDRVAKTWARIADQTGCAIDLVHHVRKTPPGQEITIEDGRGAVALINASRAARVLNPMSKDEGANLGVENPRLHFRVDSGKASMSAPPPTDKAHWFKMESVDLGNGNLGYGDNVGVVTKWTPPDPLAGITPQSLKDAQTAIAAGKWRENIQANDWVGKAIAKALSLDLAKASDKATVKKLIRTWIASGALVIVQDKDANGIQRPFVEVGEWADE